MEKITLELTVEEANVILEALGQMSFKKVYQLVNKIQQQASPQVNKNGQQTDETLSVSEEEA
ncbi:MAG: hypothetical protein GKR88_10910 [Flavobacteriaceae bacterium]|nr:MAG: hypothetical protein GKR88_10910 [Flavobacteriaceae bacterium]